MTVGESFLESPARPTSVLTSPAPLGLELFDPSSPSSPSRSPRTPSIESAHHHHDEVNFGNYRHALKISEDARTADRRAWLKGARTFREELITRETMKQADTDKKIAIIIKNRPEPPGTPSSPRARHGPRDAKAVRTPDIDFSSDVMKNVTIQRAEQARQGAEILGGWTATVGKLKATEAFASEERTAKVQDAFAQAHNLTSRHHKFQTRKAQLQELERSANLEQMRRHASETRQRSELMARMKANRERAADLRVHAWRVTIASGTDRTIHNQVLHSPRKGVGLPESPWPVYNHVPSPRRPASALPIPLSPRTPVTERH